MNSPRELAVWREGRGPAALWSCGAALARTQNAGGSVMAGRLFRHLFVLGVAAALMGAAPMAHAAAAAVAPAKPVDPRYVWDLTHLYKTPEAWRSEYDRVKAEVAKLDRFKGTLGKSARAMFEALDAMSKVQKEIARLYTYSALKADEDTSIASNLERKQLAGALFTQFGEKTAWVSPEILAIGADKVRGFMAREKGLSERFDYFLKNVLRAAPHTLGAEAEAVIASTGDMQQQPSNVYSQLTLTDMPWPTVKLSTGENVRIDQSQYTKYRQAANRADRKLVFDAFYKTFKAYESSLGATLTSAVMTNVFNAKVRRHPNALAAALFPDNMPEAVYRTLVAQANAGLPSLHRYLRMRKRLLGIAGDLRYYDGYPTMFSNRGIPVFTMEESQRITLEALRPYGDEYLGHLRRGFAERWTHAYPSPHKASGAYMNGSAYDVHPYLLLNHNDDYQGLTTFAHEWGHGVHTLLTTAAQPYEKANYSTFIAESASIGNEMLLIDYMVRNARNKAEKMYYLGQGLESIRTTFFRQVMFGEFELKIHEEFEAGRPLSGERMTEIYCDLLKRYHGDAEGVMKIDPLYCTEWAYIQHFYYNFYVYQYATSMAGAALFTDAIVKEGKPAADRFLALLRAGGSDYPYELYKRAGIDMATPAPYQALIARMNRIMDEIEALEKQPD
jgi:oligoendopeptidase F